MSDYGADAGKGTMNNFGQTPYLATDGRDLEVYLKFADGQTLRLTNNSVDDFQAVINDLGQVAYSQTVAAGNQDIFVFVRGAADAARYNFTFHYGDGDWYTGTVIAPLTQLYDVGLQEVRHG